MKKINFLMFFALVFTFFCLVACGGEKAYTVTFNSALGSAVESQTVKENETVVKPQDPVREGYSFGGWTYNGVEYDFATPVTSNITLTAKWEQTYTVTFKDGDGNVISTQQVEPGKAATAPENPTKEGYTFVKWNEDFSNVQSDLVVTPKFEEAEFTIVFKVFGEVYSKVTAFYGDYVSEPLEQEIPGYEFKGWDYDSEIVTSDMEINAIYVAKEYTLTLDNDKTIVCKPFFITFANSSQFGYNAEISPKASVQDGLLDVCIFKKPSILEVPIVATYFITKQIDKSNFIEIYKAKKISVIRDIEDVVNIDGEAISMSKDINVEINPLSLNILLNK